jgi:uncharacterized delta-60 repeat protein/uncharacterized repeat protein (TIGR01451 family)
MNQLSPVGGLRSVAGRRIGTFAYLCLVLVLSVLALLAVVLGLRTGPGRGDDPGALALGATVLDSPELSPPDQPEYNGEFVVAVLVDGVWQEVGGLGYDQFPAEERLGLDGLDLAGEVKIRVGHAGDTAAHIDSILLDGRPPHSVLGASEDTALALKKLASRDCDLIDAQGRVLVLTFDAQAGASVFSLVARIDPEHIPETPYQFPLENLYETMSEDSAFYTYIWDSQPGTLEVDGDINDEDLRTPFFKEFIEPGTGHPSAFIYGWVWNDDQRLYVAIDFVSDNTMDGDADYTTVYVKVPAGLRAFKVSVPEQTWGLPGFVYTERAVYQHKVYEFAIPLAEIGLAAPESGQPLDLAFAAYGTAGPPPPPILPGPLDPSFGGDGTVTTTIGTSDAEAQAIDIQSDGKIVVAGYSRDGSNLDFTLARYRPDGSLDPGFGTNGVVTTSIGSDAQAYGVVLRPDGEVLVAGYSRDGSNYDFALAQYDAFGNLDGTFGTGGIVTTPIGSSGDYAHAIALQQDGKVVVAGDSYIDGHYHFALARYTDTGALDASFGISGVVTTSIGGGSSHAYAIALQQGGKIVVAGYNNTGAHTVDGIVTTPVGSSSDYAYAIAPQQGGKVVVAGYTYHGIPSSDYDFALVRYDNSGNLDTSFGPNNNGMVTTTFGASDDRIYAMAVQQQDGRIVVAGTNRDYRIALARYNPNGSLDPTFGVGGKVNTDVGKDDRGNALHIQPNGRIVVAGYAKRGGGDSDFAVVRYGRDLALRKTVTPTTVSPGQAITFTLVFSNSGSKAPGAGIIDHMPVSVTVTSIISSGAFITTTGTGPTYSWEVGELAYGQVGVITIGGVISTSAAGGTFTNTANINTNVWDSDPRNNGGAARVTVEFSYVYLPLVVRES